MYHGCHVLVLGVLLHIETSTLFEFCHKLVRRARYQKKERGKGALILHTRVKTTTPRPEIKTVANMHHRCRCFFIDNVAFANENTNESYQAIKNWRVAAPKIASLATDTEKQTKKLWSVSGVVILQSKETKTASKKKTLNSKYFLQHQHTRGLQRRHTSTTTKTWVACGNSPDMRVNTRYRNSTRGTSSKRSTTRFDLSVVDG